MKWLSSLAFLRPLLPDRVALRKHLRKMALIFPLLAAVPFLQANLRDRANLEDRILAAHNRERAALGVPPLIWNAKLAGDAVITFFASTLPDGAAIRSIRALHPE